jgi:D-alanyl-D-alanine carboxypeptidase/D-alanyl-D-alanine-endopeptidase (penicillin-binding protein 4)
VLLPLALLALLGAAVGTARGGQEARAISTERAAVAVRARLTRALLQVPEQAEIGLVVVECGSGATWFEHHPRRPFKPASVMKLFTTAAALDRFGPDFTYETRLYLQDRELLVLGGGDPGLGDERIARRHGRPVHGEFDEWAQLLRQRGESTLRTIALDDSIFDEEFRHPDWPARQATAWYQAPVGGINFNDNCLDARFTAGNGRVELFLQPGLPGSFFDSALTPAAKHEPVATRAPTEDVFEFRGPVARDDAFKPISAHRPTVFFGHALQHGLEQRGVRLEGPVVRRVLTPAALAEAECLAVHATAMRDVLWRCNTFSQNMFAECLLKSLAAYEVGGARSGVAGSWDGGLRVLRETMERLGLDLAGATFRDGSGLSHDNRLTPEQIVQLLVIMQRHPQGQLYLDSLARPGGAGTLRSRRWDSPALRNRLRAKTGTLNNVSALAGYVDRADGQRLAFALLANGAGASGVRVLVAEALAEAGVSTQP